VTFLLGFVAAGLAMSLARRKASLALAAVLVFAANAAFGFARIADAAPTQTVRIGLGGDDGVIRAGAHPDAQSAETVVDTYAAAAHEFSAQQPALIVLPEKVAILTPEWRDAAIARLSQLARETHATIVIGFDDRGSERLNDALIFSPDGAAPALYAKRHMVPGLEDAFALGRASFMLPDRMGVAICKDMDFQATIRGDAARHPTLMAVPAWDFDGDRWWHARLAILRGVENGFAIARAANDGLLTLSDAYGRVLLRKSTSRTGMVTLVGDLPRGPGDTIYRRIGDVFAWAAMALAALLLGFAFVRKKY
jgi:apolipoprotein N-acyltransferase